VEKYLGFTSPPFGDAPFFSGRAGGDELIAKGAINMLSGASTSAQ